MTLIQAFRNYSNLPRYLLKSKLCDLLENLFGDVYHIPFGKGYFFTFNYGIKKVTLHVVVTPLKNERLEPKVMEVWFR